MNKPVTCTNPQQLLYEKSTRPLQSSWNTHNWETNLIATIVSKSCEKHLIHSEKLILPGLQHKKKTPRKTSGRLKCRHYACSEYSKSISVCVAKARCPELWSKLEEDKRWLSETVVLWIGLWYPRYEIKKAGRSQTTFSYFCNIFAKAAMFKELPQYPHNDCQGSGLGSFTREMHIMMAGWVIS
jgi:hypothetical protein